MKAPRPPRSYFFAFGSAHGVPEGFMREYYRHCEKVSWVGLRGKPVFWQSVLLRHGGA